jgi:hypothetical protein
MWKRFVIVFAVSLAAAGAQQLFNGKNLDGWEFLGREPGQQGFAVEGGVMHTSQGKGILWYTREKIGHATIHVVYKMSNDKGNSGVFIRIPEPPKAESVHPHPIRAQIRG